MKLRYIEDCHSKIDYDLLKARTFLSTIAMGHKYKIRFVTPRPGATMRTSYYALIEVLPGGSTRQIAKSTNMDELIINNLKLQGMEQLLWRELQLPSRRKTKGVEPMLANQDGYYNR